MRILILILGSLSVGTFACDGKIATGFKPFAVEVMSPPNLMSFKVYFPESDGAEKAMYLSAISAMHKDSFILELAVLKDEDFRGYYSALINVNAALADDVEVIGSYSYANHERTAVALCGNWKRFTLKQLLEFAETLPSHPPSFPT